MVPQWLFVFSQSDTVDYWEKLHSSRGALLSSAHVGFYWPGSPYGVFNFLQNRQDSLTLTRQDLPSYSNLRFTRQ